MRKLLISAIGAAGLLGLTASAAVSQVPAVSVTPTPATAGTTVTVANEVGKCSIGNTTVLIDFSGSTTFGGSGIADNLGNFSIPVAVPTDAVGPYQVAAACAGYQANGLAIITPPSDGGGGGGGSTTTTTTPTSTFSTTPTAAAATPVSATPRLTG